MRIVYLVYLYELLACRIWDERFNGGKEKREDLNEYYIKKNLTQAKQAIDTVRKMLENWRGRA